MMMRLLVFLLALAWAGAAEASCSTAGACSCSVSLTSIAFGSYNPYALSPTDTVGTISVTCSSPDPSNSTMSVALGPGDSGNLNARMMQADGHPLYYNLYSNAAHTVIWGDDSGGGASVAANFPADGQTPVKLNVYGRIPAQQNAWVGNYHDTVTVTVSY